jgi:fructoselysine-6-P-deglycase FrlB-like protein
MFHNKGMPALHFDASELLHFARLIPNSVALVLSRSGKSVEIVKLMARFKEDGIPVIAITNTENTPLSEGAEVCLQLGAQFDHLISITMYSGLALMGCLLVEQTQGTDMRVLVSELGLKLLQVEQQLPIWSATLEETDWLEPDRPTCFLARGSSMASASEARLLWEEVAKSNASALTTGGFRHGSQEMIFSNSRIAIWIDSRIMRTEDFALIDLMCNASAKVAVIGSQFKSDKVDLYFEVPAARDGWQFIYDVIPAQLASEQLAHRKGVSGDEFRLCPYIIDSEQTLASPEQLLKLV